MSNRVILGVYVFTRCYVILRKVTSFNPLLRFTIFVYFLLLFLSYIFYSKMYTKNWPYQNVIWSDICLGLQEVHQLFHFSPTFVFHLSTFFNWTQCVWDGKYTCKANHSRNYWRLSYFLLLLIERHLS